MTEKGTKMVARNIHVDLKLWNTVREKLGVHGNISALIRELLRDWLERQKK